MVYALGLLLPSSGRPHIESIEETNFAFTSHLVHTSRSERRVTQDSAVAVWPHFIALTSPPPASHAACCHMLDFHSLHSLPRGGCR